ncbi:MAG TPA: ribbon-helix-helix domain-containing protein [Acidiferrobacterales bacterium]|nr:ribbon-helix-helix domain-containing protein [Acidiferrobacterales bacterium]
MKAKAKPKPIAVPMYLSPAQKQELDRLAELTRIQRSVLVREAVDMLLLKYAKLLKTGGAK